MNALIDFYFRAYGWISSAPLPLLVVLTVILMVTVPVAANAIIATALTLMRGLFRLAGRAGGAEQPLHHFRHVASQLIGLLLLLSWAS